MDIVLEIIKYTLPSLVVFLTAYLLVKTLIDNEKMRRQHEVGFTNQKITTPLRLKAYERLVLYLERIAPNSIVPRTLNAKMTATQLQRELITAVRTEFEHNLSQQVYVSPQCWQAVVSAKENTVKMLNMVAVRVRQSGATEENPQGTEKPGAEYARVLLETVMEMDQSPTGAATDIVKAEAKQLFG